MVRFLTSCILALAAAASTALADRLPDDIYHVIYFPGIPSIPHFLTLDTPQGDATFNPTRLTDERAGRQLWRVTTNELSPTWRGLQSVGWAVLLGYPSSAPGTRVRGAQGDDITYYDISDSASPPGGCLNYFVRPYADDSVTLNSDGFPVPSTRPAFFRPIGQGPFAATPLCFEKVDTDA
ncbi:hypothetical protein CTheo_4965 [Ceratobasidium theobromae]|uniref:Effector protein n=1 Tax=Ceratobasidium theobromae TaxID=1582974 RepID=A0A5N5QJE1_9AGAM|nr:hypothetical protein CTheo_4965 [Ceratobasidium theobromae]